MKKPLRVQGLDVGAWGGATCLHPNGALAQVWAWKGATRKKVAGHLIARVIRDGDQWSSSIWWEPTLSHVGVQLAAWCDAPCLIVVEGAHIGKDPSVGVKQGANIGRLIAASEVKFAPENDARIVQPSEWKSIILPPQWRERMRKQHGPLKASDADKLASMAFVPSRISGLQEALVLLAALLKVELSKLHHVTDSAGVAAFVHFRDEDPSHAKPKPVRGRGRGAKPQVGDGPSV